MGPKLSRPLGEGRKTREQRIERSVPDTVNQNLSPGLHPPLLIPSDEDVEEGGVVEEGEGQRLDVNRTGGDFYSPLVEAEVEDSMEMQEH